MRIKSETAQQTPLWVPSKVREAQGVWLPLPLPAAPCLQVAIATRMEPLGTRTDTAGDKCHLNPDQERNKEPRGTSCVHTHARQRSAQETPGMAKSEKHSDILI